MKHLKPSKIDGGSECWMTIADMMTGLMMIFMFIAVAYLIDVHSENRKIEEIATTYSVLKEDLYNDLYNEFKEDLEKWQAEIDRKTLSVRFKEPSVFFDANQSTLKSQFKKILSDFFPRYISILSGEKYKIDIEEVRIEGHTSSEWRGSRDSIKGYLENMGLSQSRTRSVLAYVMNIDELKRNNDWLIKHVTANGLSYSQRIYENGSEDKHKSRRVEFRVRTKAEKRIEQILEYKGANNETT